jgi:hypothetical protein
MWHRFILTECVALAIGFGGLASATVTDEPRNANIPLYALDAGVRSSRIFRSCPIRDITMEDPRSSQTLASWSDTPKAGCFGIPVWKMH